MKHYFNEDFSDINNKEILSLLGSLDINTNKNYNTYNSNNSTNNNFNYNFNSEFLKRTKRKKRQRNEREQVNLQATFDLGTSLSYMKNQLNNISLNGRNPLKMSKIKNGESPNNKSYYFSANPNHKKLKTQNIAKQYKEKSEWNSIISQTNQICFSILKAKSVKYDVMIKNKDLEKENDLLKENIKFLLAQIKKMKKNDEIKDSSNKKFDKIQTDTNRNTECNINSNNKLTNVFDIISKYKKDIFTLKQELNKLNNENKELKEYIINNTKKENNNKIIQKKSMKVFQKKNILNSKRIKDSFNTLFNKKPPLNHRNKPIDLLPYRKKSFNKTFSKNDNINNNNESNTNNNTNKYNYTLKTIHFNEKICLNTERNKRKEFNTIKRDYKGENIFIIDSDYAGDEKIMRKINPVTNKRYISQLHFSTIMHNDTNKSYMYSGNSVEMTTPTYFKKDLYLKKQISSNEVKKIKIKNFFQKKSVFSETKNKDLKIQKKEYDKNMLKLKIQKLFKNDE
jgi:hypothetical protein